MPSLPGQRQRRRRNSDAGALSIAPLLIHCPLNHHTILLAPLLVHQISATSAAPLALAITARSIHPKESEVNTADNARLRIAVRHLHIRFSRHSEDRKKEARTTSATARAVESLELSNRQGRGKKKKLPPVTKPMRFSHTEKASQAENYILFFAFALSKYNAGGQKKVATASCGS